MPATWGFGGAGVLETATMSGWGFPSDILANPIVPPGPIHKARKDYTDKLPFSTTKVSFIKAPRGKR